MELLNTLAETAADAGDAKDAFETSALRELSISLCQGNAVICRAGLTVMAQTAGSDLVLAGTTCSVCRFLVDAFEPFC